MKVSVDRGALLNSLKIIGPAFSLKTTLPVLAFVKVAVDGSAMTLECTNLEIGIRTKMLVIPEEPGAICLPYKLLLDLVSSFTGSSISIEIGKSYADVQIKCGKSKTRIAGISANEFPPLPVPSSEGTQFPDMKEITSLVSFAVNKFDDRPILQGINLRRSKNAFTANATDGFRLSSIKIPFESNGGDATIPPKVLTEIGKLANPTIHISDNRIFAHDDVTEIVGLTIAGTYPDFAQIIPKNCAITVEVNTQELIRAVHQAQLFSSTVDNIADSKTISIKGEIQDSQDGLKLSGTDDETGNIETWIPAKIVGPAVPEFKLNASYVLDVCKAAHSEELVIELTTPFSPIVFKAKDFDNWTNVIMPIHK